MAVSVSIKVNVPDRLLNDARVRSEIERVLRSQTAPDLRRQFAKTTEGWDNRPNFSQKFASRNDYLSATVYTTQQQYAIVNAGSPAHTITPRRGGMLRFQPGYRASTKPRVISSRAKQRSGSVIAARSVQHPGFEAREFDQTIAENYAGQFEEDVQNAISRASGP
jgi:hypothetical protein